MEYNCCICGTVRNCGPYLDKVFENILKISTIFKKYEIIIFYDNSTDNSIERLEYYKSKIKNLKFYQNKHSLSKFRTHNLANARNYLLNYVKAKQHKFDFFIMMDMDDVNAKDCNINVLKYYLNRTDWDGLSFNTDPMYYDIWALSKQPFTFSYNHFPNNNKYHKLIGKYMDMLLKKIPEDKLLSCISSFNGFSIYRTNKFMNTKYDGFPRPELLPPHLLNMHKQIMKSNIIYKIYPTVDGRVEDCEHRAFHISAIQNSHAKIRISPKVLFK
jgi:hypothetical protein